jgi:tetratricopeptide (TPR) repeat protein
VKRDKRKAGKELGRQAKSRKTMQRELARHALLLGVILLAMLAYSNSFHAPFLLDNNETILLDTRVHAATSENLDAILGRPYYQAILAGLYRPLTTLSFLFNYAVLGNGPEPNGYHWFNFWLHAVNIVLVYLLGLALFEEIPAALALSALWGLHPVLTEAVTNIVGRADAMAAFGVLAALLCYRASLRSEGSLRFAWIAAIALVTGIGMCSKESAVVAIAVIALYDWTFERTAPWRSRAIGYAAVALPALAFFIARARVMGRFPAGPFPYTDNPLLGANFLVSRLTAVKIIGKYLGLLVWPARLAPDYSFREIPVAIDAKAIAALIVCLGAMALAIWSWRRHKPLFFAILFFFVTLAPMSNVFMLIGSIMGERFLYLPAVGFAAAVVYGLREIVARVPRSRTAVAVTLAVVLVAFASRAYARNRDWLDGRQFWRSAVEVVPDNFKARLGEAASTPLIKRADRALVVADLERALTILRPLPDVDNSGFAFRQAGVLYRQLGDELSLHRAEPDGTDPAYWYQKSLETLQKSGDIEFTLDAVYRQINERRGTPQSTFLPSLLYLEIGRTYLRLFRQRDAIAVFEYGRKLESNPDLLEELAATHENFHEYRDAARDYVEAMEMDSRRTYISDKLVDLYGKVDPQGCSISHESGGASLNPACPLVHADICDGARNVAHNYDRRNQTTEAASIRRVAIGDLGCTEAALK